MSKTVVFRPQAEDELLEVQRWYDSRGAGLGTQFGQAVEWLIDRIADNPLSFPRVHDETRRAVMQRLTPSTSESKATALSSWRSMGGSTHRGGKGASSVQDLLLGFLNWRASGRTRVTATSPQAVRGLPAIVRSA